MSNTEEAIPFEQIITKTQSLEKGEYLFLENEHNYIIITYERTSIFHKDPLNKELIQKCFNEQITDKDLIKLGLAPTGDGYTGSIH